MGTQKNCLYEHTKHMLKLIYKKKKHNFMFKNLTMTDLDTCKERQESKFEGIDAHADLILSGQHLHHCQICCAGLIYSTVVLMTLFCFHTMAV